MISDFAKNIKTSSGCDEYYSPQNVVDMIVPYVLRGGTKLSGVRLTNRKVYL